MTLRLELKGKINDLNTLACSGVGYGTHLRIRSSCFTTSYTFKLLVVLLKPSQLLLSSLERHRHDDHRHSKLRTICSCYWAR